MSTMTKSSTLSARPIEPDVNHDFKASSNQSGERRNATNECLSAPSHLHYLNVSTRLDLLLHVLRYYRMGNHDFGC
jgi:hypothetical protein